MKNTFQIPLNIPDVRLLSTELENDSLILAVESTLNDTRCRRCSQTITTFHGYDRAIRLRHMPVLGHKVYIEIKPKRYVCSYCDDHPTTTQTLSWYQAKSPHTTFFDTWLLKVLINSTVSDVSRHCEVSIDSLEGTIKRRVPEQIDWKTFNQLPTLGIDEIAIRKGHKHYVVVVTTLNQANEVCILAILPNRLKQTVCDFLNSIPERLKATVTRVCTDMYEGYSNAAKECLPNACVVIDRFHVAKYYHNCLDTLRKKTLAELKSSLSKEAYAELKGTLWLFRHHLWDLEKEQQKHLMKLLNHSPDLKAAYLFRHQLTILFDTPLSRQEAAQQLEEWKRAIDKSGLRCFDKFINLLNTWQSDILNYFDGRYSSGFVEGFNQKLKVIKRRCYGITKPKQFFQRILIDLQMRQSFYGKA